MPDDVVSKLDLNSLLLPLHGLTLQEKEAVGRDLYAKLYLTSQVFGIHGLHDGQEVIFHVRQFDHAFFTSPDLRNYPNRKDKLDEHRVERVRWIAELISGRVGGSACWEVGSRSGRPGLPNRLYVVYSPGYVVWLEPRTRAGVNWSFSSDYSAPPAYLREITKTGARLAVF